MTPLDLERIYARLATLEARAGIVYYHPPTDAPQGKTLVEIFEEEDADEDFKAWLISNAGDFSPDGL